MLFISNKPSRKQQRQNHQKWLKSNKSIVWKVAAESKRFPRLARVQCQQPTTALSISGPGPTGPRRAGLCCTVLCSWAWGPWAGKARVAGSTLGPQHNGSRVVGREVRTAGMLSVRPLQLREGKCFALLSSENRQFSEFSISCLELWWAIRISHGWQWCSWSSVAQHRARVFHSWAAGCTVKLLIEAWKYYCKLNKNA